ncbi:cupin domain-containing protein, partial [Leclercia adecarboxylata]|uniref:hypothetical protein n=1 Tax=Leclercia adecarboxylata TaxID=83655 RepID=UPI00234DF425
MSAMPGPIQELHDLDPAQLHAQLRGWTTPKVIRGLVAGWPLVAPPTRSAQAAVDHLKQFDHGALPVTATTAPPEARGRV